jgi:hypothetical protein
MLYILLLGLVYFYEDDSRNVILLTLFHVGLLITMPLAFLTSYTVRHSSPRDAGTSGLYAFVELVNFVSSIIALILRIFNYLNCSTDAFCSDPSGLGFYVVNMLLVVTAVIVGLSLSGFLCGMYIYYTITDESRSNQFWMSQRSNSKAVYYDPNTLRPVYGSIYLKNM